MKSKCSLAAILLVVGAVVLSGTASAGPPPGCTLDVPTLECVGSTATSITLRVCAGASGAPAGVSIQWKLLSDWNLNGWASGVGDSYSALSLSGNCPASRFDLGPFLCENITINAATVISENGSNCGASGTAADLLCDRDYIFRVFAHNQPGPGGCNASCKSGDAGCAEAKTICRTARCTVVGECTLTWGYWKTHGPVGCNPSGNQPNDWNVTELTIGCQLLSDAQLCDILQQNPSACAKGGGSNNGANAVLILQHQLIAAMLNRAEGAIVCAFADQAILDANALLCGQEYACVGTSTVLGQQMLAVKDVLAAYNADECSCPVQNPKPQAAPAGAAGKSVKSAKSTSWGDVKVIYR